MRTGHRVQITHLQKFFSRCFATAVACLTALVASHRLSAIEISVVTLQGEHLVGLETNELLYDWKFAHGINNTGQVAFLGEIARQSDDGKYTQLGNGLWVGKPGHLSLLAREGEPAPGFDADIVFSDIKEEFAFNDQGKVAFLASVGTSRTRSLATGLFAGTPGKLQLIAKDGDPAIGFESVTGRVELQADLNFSHHTRFSLNDTGEIAWTARIEGTQQFGVWLTQESSTTWLSQRNGETLPGSIINLSISDKGQVAFSTEIDARLGKTNSLFLWDRTQLRDLISSGAPVGDSTITVKGIHDVLFASDESLNMTLLLKTTGVLVRPTSIWQWRNGEFHPIHHAGTEVVDDLLVSRSASLLSGLGSQVIPFNTCSTGIDSLSPVCEPVLHLIANGVTRTIAYRGMPFPNGPEGTTVIFDRVPGLRKRAVLTNDRGLALVHLGIRGPDGGETQGIYRVDGGNYDPIIEAGDELVIDREKPSRATFFTIFADPRSDVPIRSFNNHNDLLLTVNTRESPKALVVLSLDEAPSITMQRTETSLQLTWDGTGILEQASEMTAPWVSTPNQATEQAIPLNQAKLFFRIRR